MATATVAELVLDENTDPVVTITVTLNGAVFNGTGFAIEIYVKSGRDTADASPKFVHKSTDGAPKIVWTSIATGIAQWSPTRTDLTPAGQYWYRIDVVSATQRLVAAKGPLSLVDD